MGTNQFLEKSLTQDGAQFARIYGFSYQGQYRDMQQPTLFLVHGNGEELHGNQVDTTGIAITSKTFASDVRVWSYDKNEFSVRINVKEAGEGLLLGGLVELAPYFKEFLGTAVNVGSSIVLYQQFTAYLRQRAWEKRKRHMKKWKGPDMGFRDWDDRLGS